MLTLFVPVAPPQIPVFRIRGLSIDATAQAATVTVEVVTAGGAVLATFTLNIRNGPSDGLRAKGSPTSLADALEVFTVQTPNGFTNFVSALFAAAPNLAARARNLETQGMADVWLPGGVIS